MAAARTNESAAALRRNSRRMRKLVEARCDGSGAWWLAEDDEASGGGDSQASADQRGSDAVRIWLRWRWRGASTRWLGHVADAAAWLRLECE
uniref:Uncharacterized protein n=1 Tax=Aegilops tauschii TaxID=37682 RepID=N1R1E6_AEGTA